MAVSHTLRLHIKINKHKNLAAIMNSVKIAILSLALPSDQLETKQLNSLQNHQKLNKAKPNKLLSSHPLEMCTNRQIKGRVSRQKSLCRNDRSRDWEPELLSCMYWGRLEGECCTSIDKVCPLCSRCEILRDITSTFSKCMEEEGKQAEGRKTGYLDLQEALGSGV